MSKYFFQDVFGGAQLTGELFGCHGKGDQPFAGNIGSLYLTRHPLG